MQVHPVSLGLFNFVNAWSMMFWPIMLADRKGGAVKNRFKLWLGTQVRPITGEVLSAYSQSFKARPSFMPGLGHGIGLGYTTAISSVLRMKGVEG